MSEQAIRIFGPPDGASGVRVIERIGVTTIQEPSYGGAVMVAYTKRGPEGVPIPVTSKSHYNYIFGDPANANWHLFEDASHLGPDSIDGFFQMSGGEGVLYVIRVDQDGQGRKAELIGKSPQNSEVLKFTAANKGRWGGYKRKLAKEPLVLATARSFSIHEPTAQGNEFLGATAIFSDGSGRKYTIVGSSEPDEQGIVDITVSSQFNLIEDGIHGPVLLSGLSSYSRLETLPGTVEFPDRRNLTGTFDTRTINITGTGSVVTDELTVGANVYSTLGEVRVVQAIQNATSFTVDRPFTSGATGQTLQVNNLTVTGTGTFFTALSSGKKIIFSALVGGQLETYERTILAVVSDTELVLTSGLPLDIPSGSNIQTYNFWVQGDANTAYPAELQPGDYAIDPNSVGSSVLVVEVDAVARRFRIQEAFSADFTTESIRKQSQFVDIELTPGLTEGLRVELFPGVRYPMTHFGVKVYFNNSLAINIPDASLDPADELFVEALVNNANIAHKVGNKNYYSYITCENLWRSAYLTSESNDVRPFNGAGKVLALNQQRIYSIGEFDYEASVNHLIYLNPYARSRSTMRIKKAQAPVMVEGTVSSNGATVTGTDTNFMSVFSNGDFIYDPHSETAREIRLVKSDTELVLVSQFPVPLPPLTEVKKAGYLQVDRGIDLAQATQIGQPFIVSFPEQLKGGADSNSAAILPYDYAKYYDVDSNLIGRALAGKNLGLVRLSTPGVSLIGVVRQAILYCERNALEYRYEIPDYLSPAPAESFVNDDIGRSPFATVCYPSYGYISNPLRQGIRMIPLTGDVIGLESYYASTNKGYHVPAAGVDASLTRILSLPYEIEPGEEASLTRVGIQPIKTLFGMPVVWGAEQPTNDPVYTFIHVRRIQSNFVRVFLEALPLLRMLFRPNQPDLANQLVMIVNSYMREQYRRGVFNNYLTYDEAVKIRVEAPNELQRSISNMDNNDVLAKISQGNLNVHIDYIPTGVLKNLFVHLGPDILAASFSESN